MEGSLLRKRVDDDHQAILIATTRQDKYINGVRKAEQRGLLHTEYTSDGSLVSSSEGSGL
jgi:hypothetical protein